MSFPKLITVVKDVATTILNEADLTRMHVGEVVKTPERDVPHSNGLKWHIQYYPAGHSTEYENHLSLYLSVNKPVSVTYKFKVDNSSIQAHFSYDFAQYFNIGVPRFSSHALLRPLFVSGRLSLTFEVEFDVSTFFTSVAPRVALYSDHVPTDFVLIVDSNRVRVHKSLLSLMSPVFHAMLSHDTAESRRGEVKITDFNFYTVKTAIDFCYGREMETPFVETIFDILRFADKYDIKSVTNLIEKMPQLTLSIPTFPAMIRYADEFFKDDLFDKCCKFFEEHRKDIVETEKFATLSPPLVARLLKQVYDLNTEFDILRCAQAYEITFVLDPLEQPIIDMLSVENFCDTVSYAWDCSRDELKKACAKFFHEHFAEISIMEAFTDLGQGVVHGVMKQLREIMLADK